MVTSPCGDKSGRNDDSLKGEDSFRKEYLQALSEFRARRSLGLNNTNLGKTSDITTPDNKKLIAARKTKSEQKPKRRSLPEAYSSTQILSQTLPQIQLLFSNQIFMAGSKQNSKKLRKRQSGGNKSSIGNSSTSRDSPDLRSGAADFDADDSASPRSPPPEFFRNNSLPYADKDACGPIGATPPYTKPSPKKAAKHHESQQSLANCSKGDIYESIRRLSKDSTSRSREKAEASKIIVDEFANVEQQPEAADTSMDSITRRLEEKCQIHNKVLSKGHFRGAPLVRRATLHISTLMNQESSLTGEGLTRARWDAVPVTLRAALDAEYTARDIDILTSVRHPNILLLMGIAYDAAHRIECVFEECTATLYELLYEQKVHLSLNTCVEYLSDITNAASHLLNNGFIHTAISSHTILLTSRGLAKLFGFELCSKVCSSNPNSKSSPKKKKCEPYKLIYSSPEPEYENLKGRLRRSNVSESEQNNADPPPEDSALLQCTPQRIEERELLTHFRWQAPELFDDSEKQVVPTTTTDVYSICLVLWECFNGVVPWRSLSYKHLSDLYLLWQTGIRLKKGRYPVLIQDILKEGLSLEPEDRMSIKDLSTRLTHVKNFVHFGSDAFIGETCNFAVAKTDLDKPNSYGEQMTQGDAKGLDEVHNQITVSVHNVSEPVEDLVCSGNCVLKQSPVDPNQPTNCLNLSSILPCSTDASDEPFSEHEEMSPTPNTAMHKTDSTEYCSFLTPDLKRFASRLHDPDIHLKPSKLDMDESSCGSPDNSLQEKIKRLNSNFTPKSYKSLKIETPSSDRLQMLTKLTKRLGSADRCRPQRRSTCHFDIMNTSLPNTPIARNTKIRKYAWLSGDDEDTREDFDRSKPCGVEPLGNENGAEEAGREQNTEEQGEAKQTAGHDAHLEDRSELDGERKLEEAEALTALFTQRPMPRSNNPSVDNLGFRSRSQSWSSRSRTTMRGSEVSVTGVDIKPLVAIHEKWIEAAKQKHNRSLSLPDNYRGPANAVKPASHRVDPVLPYSPNSHSFITAKKTFKKKSPLKGSYCNIPNPVRPAIAKTMTVYPKPEDFFENSLWRKEKEKCLSYRGGERSPQGSSTPYKDKCLNDSMTQTDQATNTDTFEELCEAIIRQLRIQGLLNTDAQKDSCLTSMSPRHNGLEGDKANNNICHNTHYGEMEMHTGATNIPHNQSRMDVDGAGCKNMKTLAPRGAVDEDCLSLPELKGEVVNKTLKRCQAFSALQAARSTEDMYIDDELCANNDVHALSHNMLLAPVHSSVHEALCEKANNCCLVKIKEESSSETILIVCDNSHRSLTARPHSSSSNSSESEFEPNDATIEKMHHLKIDTLPSVSLTEASSTPQALSVIEEIPGEEDPQDSDGVLLTNNSKNIQDLISLYENKVKCKNAVNTSHHCNNTRADEISFLILDNLEECDEDLHASFAGRSSADSESVIQDYIMI